MKQHGPTPTLDSMLLYSTSYSSLGGNCCTVSAAAGAKSDGGGGASRASACENEERGRAREKTKAFVGAFSSWGHVRMVCKRNVLSYDGFA